MELNHVVTFRVSDDEHERLKKIAAREERKLADVVRRIFRRGFKLVRTTTGAGK